jgi:hypothetical protein
MEVGCKRKPSLLPHDLAVQAVPEGLQHPGKYHDILYDGSQGQKAGPHNEGLPEGAFPLRNPVDQHPAERPHKDVDAVEGIESTPRIEIACRNGKKEGSEGSEKGNREGSPAGPSEITRQESEKKEQYVEALDPETVHMKIEEGEVIPPEKGKEDKGRPCEEGIESGDERPNRR